ncbi:glycosyltransferase family 4 protein [Metabacillus sediminilitoris]|uniref:Glycosyltransferase family 4 protein n=1 Tax=Metabacillus sediminilitoris TaxID=2567941 RepID=A0A4S4C154_9BACI|nr:glycosyltransferase family 4 protein [Metabacillus sediminilitoris]QGQ48269.1 hypothetical protein GMB29_25195 [Metabacillus sediminilitoris]THF81373.1 glycosyltransferase family 4 protein [Metabacillus sediminilitoris]
MHIVFIVGNYYPYYSAVGNCVGNVADELAKGNKVTVICQKNFNEQADVEVFNKQKIIRVATRENNVREILSSKINTEKGFKKKIYKVLQGTYKVSRVIKTTFSRVTLRKELVNSYLDTLYNIQEPIDLIIPACMPFESVIAACKFKSQYQYSEVQIIPYLFDNFVDNESLHRTKINMKLKRKKHLLLEEDMLKNTSSILIMNQLREHFSLEFPNFEDKLVVVEHPLLKQYSEDPVENKGSIELIYAGSFYKKIRDPKYFLKVVDNALSCINATIHLYTFGNCNEIIEKYSKMDKPILNHGKVSTEKAYKELNKANILIAVGNSNNKQVPSKIFEYLSFGKPIIYFYSNPNDTNLEILNKYPLSLCLKQDDDKFEDNVKLFVEFCDKHKYSHISYEVVEKLFKDATPKYTAEIIKKIYEESNI